MLDFEREKESLIPSMEFIVVHLSIFLCVNEYCSSVIEITSVMSNGDI